MTDQASSPPCCANCSKSEGDQVKLKSCLACKLVKYCGRECQLAHRPQHKQECKKRAAELHEDALFKDPPKGEDCPICFHMIPNANGTKGGGNQYWTCCGKIICTGCCFSTMKSCGGRSICPFCRAQMPLPTEYVVQIKKRIELNDAHAFFHLGVLYSNGDPLANIPKDKAKAVELWKQAAQLGSMKATFHLGRVYSYGEGFPVDMKKGKYYFEQAAMAGCASSRYYIGAVEAKAHNFDVSQKHFQIAAAGGSIGALKNIQKAYMQYGLIPKEDYEKALRAYQKYLDEVKTDQREEAASCSDDFQYILDS